ncbi:hypothetical protein BJ980_000016 [Nocardioides daedukensis]|uniref:DUF2231 domain-containing protein n=1 Tax=Nocardioides daedukensis TaxID=634462 RepID=A0A7Y9RYJ4_9ACTN|nr:DUF2231 domain-containing protein [Nocardioides daedukensis]NYG57093.1 hypothetical protein [Nocardioides daedukensis]
MNALEPPAPLVRLTLKLEEATALDGAVQAIEPHILKLFGSGIRGSVLRGDWLGHAVHPVLATVVLGSWTSASVLDLIGRGKWAEPAQSLVGTGLLTVGPTAWAGWAEWSTAGPREKRVGLVHAVTNAVAIGTYAGSWIARRRGHHDTGARLALLGAAVAGAGGYLGGHLAAARKVSTHHPVFDAAPPGA